MSDFIHLYATVASKCVHGTWFEMVISNKIADWTYLSPKGFEKYKKQLESGEISLECGGLCGANQSEEKHYSVGHTVLTGDTPIKGSTDRPNYGGTDDGSI